MHAIEGIPKIGHRVESAVCEAWTEDSSTIIDDEPFLLCVRKLEAVPADDVEELETMRVQLHETVDHLVDRALASVGELRALVERVERRSEQLSAELECVVRHSNALVEASHSQEDTLIEFPAARLRAVGG